ncbi:MAG: Na+/H+ antiporter NhaA [Gammaproteobacteria bacterium]|nr:Na+/H+ antiporter NhaA [Gammaproteobacteria bacterium]MCP5201477.1 Na+/H+ antiporter NhaA [Gammaproteobacteria bacterium]
MHDTRQVSAHQYTNLPHQAIERVYRPLSQYMAIETTAGFMLLFFAGAAVVLSNSPWGPGYQALWETPLGFRLGPWEATRAVRAWINDGLMTLFFFLVSLELKREIVLGELRNPRIAALSIAGAAGGMLVPSVMYLAVLAGEPGHHGWGTVMATDTAFAIGCVSLLGTRAPQSLRVFLLSLAIVDDIGAILVVALGYTAVVAWVPLGIAALGLVAIRAMRLLGFRSLPLYFLAGGLVWIAVDASGIHATIAGVALGLMTPARRWVCDERLYAILDQVVAHPTTQQGSGDTRDRETLRMAEVALRETLSPNERLEMVLHPWVAFVIMPLFALANAGVPLAAMTIDVRVVTAIVVGLVIGKPLGVLTFSWLAVRSGLAVRPPELAWTTIAGAGLLAGIAFTMAIFIADLAFTGSLGDSAKLGILIASIVAALGGLALLRWHAGGSAVDEALHGRGG